MVQWSATPISPDDDFDGAPLLRGEFVLDEGHGSVVRATLHATAQGVFEAFLNGHPVSEDVLSPGWSSYEWRLRYRSYDVTSLVQPRSVIGVALGNGWFRGRLGWCGDRALYGDELAVLMQLEIEFTDGYIQNVVTDESWVAGPSAVLFNDLYDGQTIDAQRYSDAWLQGSFSDDAWTGVHAVEFDLSRLTPYIGPPVRRQEELQSIKIWTSPAGKTLVDFGQNLVGWVQLRVRGPAGTTITVRHAEVLEHDELGTRPLRTAEATDHFILSGKDDAFEPTFTFHGFRYVEVEGWPGELTADGITAVVVSSELSRIGEFECSDELLNQLHRNVVWGTRGQLSRYTNRLSAARRAARLDRRYRSLRPNRDIPLRCRELPPGVVGQPLRRAAGSRRDGALRRTGRSEVRKTPFFAISCSRKHRDLERRGRLGALGSVAGVRERSDTERSVRLDGRARSPSGVTAVAHRTVGYRLPGRRLAGPNRTARSTGPRQGRQGCGGDRLPLSGRADSCRNGRASQDERKMPSTLLHSPSAPELLFMIITSTLTAPSTATRRPRTPWP
jgi:hypothetical protein